MTGTQCIMRDNSQKVNNANLCAKLWHGYNNTQTLPGTAENRFAGRAGDVSQDESVCIGDDEWNTAAYFETIFKV